MALLPNLQVISGESLTSYVNRVASYHCGLELVEFLRFFEVSQFDIMGPNLRTLEQISDLTGQSKLELVKMTFRRLGDRHVVINDETVHSQFFDLSKRPFCPKCLIEDSDAESLSQGMPIGRIEWQMDPVRVCGKHELILQAKKVKNYSDRFRFLPELNADPKVLENMMAHTVQHKPSQLQKYVVNRIAGGTGPEWLDAQPLDQAARACEMLGVIQIAGTHANLLTVTGAQWSEAGNIGFGYASRGISGIKSGLQYSFDDFVSKNLKGGPQKAFGRFYQWLQFNKNKRELGPIRDIAREFVLDHFPIEPGTKLMGAIVKEQRVHTVYTLSRKTGDHPSTINRAMILAGLAEGGTEKLTATMVFDAKASEKLMQDIRNSISVTTLEEYLNCGRTLAQDLVKVGIVERLLPENDKISGVLKSVNRESADKLLHRLMQATEIVPMASDGMMNIFSAAEVSRWPTLDIVRGILSGMFSRVEMIDPNLKIKGLLVNPVDVRQALQHGQIEGYIGFEDAVVMIGMAPEALNKILQMQKQDGSPYLGVHVVNNAKGIPVRLFSVDELQAFCREYVSLKECAEVEMTSPLAMKIKLDERGIMPIAPKYKLGRIWYRREDLEAI